MRINLTYNHFKEHKEYHPTQDCCFNGSIPEKKQHPLRIFCFQDKNVDFPQEVLGIPAVNVVSPSANNAPDHGTDAGIAYFASWLVIWTGKTVIKTCISLKTNGWKPTIGGLLDGFFPPSLRGKLFFRFQPFVSERGGYNLHSLMSFLKRGW